MPARRLIFPMVLGFGGLAILLALGFWQLQRLEWKTGILREIEAVIAGPTVPLPDAPTAGQHRYLPVALSGRLTGQALPVLTSRKGQGPGYRLIAAFETETGRRLLLDRGFLPEARLAGYVAPEGLLRLRGNLYWPDETDRFTPPPDPARGIWFARDVATMARALGTEPVMVVVAAAEPDDPLVTPLPVDTARIPNDHLQYAVTWFLLAAAWAGMTGLLLWRIRQRQP
ncbi:MAG: SURF1 family protein [Gemmobacter sp.]